MKEKWQQWIPLSHLEEKYYIESISESKNGFEVILANAKKSSKKILILFANSVNAFRNTNETFRLVTIDYLNKNYDVNFYSNWTFFKVENSEYIKWLSEQSHGISASYGVMHFSIVTDEQILDFACTYEPTVTFLD